MEALTIVKTPQAMAVLDVEEQRIVKAASTRKIESIPDAELYDELLKAFSYIATDTGYNITDEWKKIVLRLTSIIRKFYNDLTLVDIMTAWQMLIMGELDEFLPKDSQGNPDRKHYQQFNFEYIAKVLNAYTQKRVKALQKARNAMPETPKKVTDAERNYWMNLVKENIANVFYRFKYCGRLEFGSGIEESLAAQMLLGYDIDLNEQREIISAEFPKIVNNSASAVMKRKELRELFTYFVETEKQIKNYL